MWSSTPTSPASILSSLMERQVVALVDAHEDRSASTAPSPRSTLWWDEVIVVDDGSTDATIAALLAGAHGPAGAQRLGEGRAIEEALGRLRGRPCGCRRRRSGRERGAPRSAARRGREGRADSRSRFPESSPRRVRDREAGRARSIRALCGWETRAPLSGQRALTAYALAAVRPLAPGFGLEVGMTIDAVRAGLRVVEIPVEGLTHRPTGRGPRGFAHRARQGVDIVGAVRLTSRATDFLGAGGPDRAGGGGRVVRGGAWRSPGSAGWEPQRGRTLWKENRGAARSPPRWVGRWRWGRGDSRSWFAGRSMPTGAGFQAGELLGAGVVFLAGVGTTAAGGRERRSSRAPRALLAGRLTPGA